MMIAQPDTYQSFFPKLKPKSTTGKVLVPTVLNDLKSKILNIKTKLSSSKISVVQKTKSSSNFTQLTNSSIHSRSTKSNQLITGAQTKPIHSSKLFKVHSDCFESVRSNKHLRYLSGINQNPTEFSVIHPVLSLNRYDLNKGGLTERKRKKLKFEEKKFKIIESPKRKIVVGKAEEVFCFGGGQKKEVEVERAVGTEERKFILLNKLVECNESLASSLSSTIYERAPRYRESQG